MADRKKFSELSPVARGFVIATGAVQLGLAGAAAIDLVRRPAAEVRGPKLAGGAALFVNVVGPLSYFAFGRRR